MNILVVNDDGITADGIEVLTRHASQFGSVTVVAPENQCSAMSQKLSIFDKLNIYTCAYTHDCSKAYSISGTPADCVKIAVELLLDNKPDYVFSGINNGYNLGFDIAYSGTIGACFEALQLGIPAIAFSTNFHSDFEIVDTYIDEIISELVSNPPSSSELYNVNFPHCSSSECQGILRDVPIAKAQYYSDNYDTEQIEIDCISAKAAGHIIYRSDVPTDTDISAIIDNYITISKVKNPVL